ESCVEFCTRLTAECALPWAGKTSCVLGSEEAFRRDLFWRDNADRPEAILHGRVVDEAGHRIEGAPVRIGYARTPVAEQVTAKDGLFHVPLRAVPGAFSVRVEHAGHVTEVAEIRLAAADKPDRSPPPRVFRLVAEATLKGKVVGDDDGE